MKLTEAISILQYCFENPKNGEVVKTLRRQTEEETSKF